MKEDCRYQSELFLNIMNTAGLTFKFRIQLINAGLVLTLG